MQRKRNRSSNGGGGGATATSINLQRHRIYTVNDQSTSYIACLYKTELATDPSTTRVRVRVRVRVSRVQSIDFERPTICLESVSPSVRPSVRQWVRPVPVGQPPWPVGQARLRIPSGAPTKRSDIMGSKSVVTRTCSLAYPPSSSVRPDRSRWNRPMWTPRFGLRRRLTDCWVKCAAASVTSACSCCRGWRQLEQLFRFNETSKRLKEAVC